MIGLNNVFMVATNGFRSLEERTQVEIIKRALDKITPKTDMVVFRKFLSGDKEHYEDEDRTFVMALPDGCEKKVYVKLDDFKGNEERSFGFRWVITFMLADEY